MPRPKIDVTRERCNSCGERTGCSNEDAECHGCKLIICGECTEDYGHFGWGGNHGLKKPLKFAAQRAVNMRERDRRFSLQNGSKN